MPPMLGPHSLDQNRYRSRGVVDALWHQREEDPDSNANTNEITKAVTARLPLSQHSHIPHVVSAVQGLLRGMNPKNAQEFLGALLRNSQSANAVAITDNAIENELLKQEDMTRRAQQERLQQDNTQENKILAAWLRIKSANIGSAEALAAAAVLLSGTQNIAQAWANYERRRRNLDADSGAMIVAASFAPATSTRSGNMARGVDDDAGSSSVIIPAIAAMTDVSPPRDISHHHHEPAYVPPIYVDPRTEEEKRKAAELEQNRGVEHVVPGVVTRVHPENNAPYSVRQREQGDNRNPEEIRRAEEYERRYGLTPRPGVITRVDPGNNAPRSERLDTDPRSLERRREAERVEREQGVEQLPENVTDIGPNGAPMSRPRATLTPAPTVPNLLKPFKGPKNFSTPGLAAPSEMPSEAPRSTALSSTRNQSIPSSTLTAAPQQAEQSPGVMDRVAGWGRTVLGWFRRSEAEQPKTEAPLAAPTSAPSATSSAMPDVPPSAIVQAPSATPSQLPPSIPITRPDILRRFSRLTPPNATPIPPHSLRYQEPERLGVDETQRPVLENDTRLRGFSVGMEGIIARDDGTIWNPIKRPDGTWTAEIVNGKDRYVRNSQGQYVLESDPTRFYPGTENPLAVAAPTATPSSIPSAAADTSPPSSTVSASPLITPTSAASATTGTPSSVPEGTIMLDAIEVEADSSPNGAPTATTPTATPMASVMPRSLMSRRNLTELPGHKPIVQAQSSTARLATFNAIQNASGSVIRGQPEAANPEIAAAASAAPKPDQVAAASPSSTPSATSSAAPKNEQVASATPTATPTARPNAAGPRVA